MKASWEKYLKFRCTGCGNCCRNTVVCITDGDVRRIVDGTGMSPLEFVRFYDHDQVAVSQSDPLWVKFKEGRAVMGLRAKYDHCFFLESKTNRCKIYEHRPLTCRDHPFSFTYTDTGAIEKLWLSRIVPCPHEWDGNLTRSELKKISQANEKQEEAYVDKVRTWNRDRTMQKTKPGFLRYLGFKL